MSVDRDTFEREYATRSGVTVDMLHQWGLYAEPCRSDCDYETCQGWQMGHPLGRSDH